MGNSDFLLKILDVRVSFLTPQRSVRSSIRSYAILIVAQKPDEYPEGCIIVDVRINHKTESLGLQQMLGRKSQNTPKNAKALTQSGTEREPYPGHI